jgi:hypothetical protein
LYNFIRVLTCNEIEILVVKYPYEIILLASAFSNA